MHYSERPGAMPVSTAVAYYDSEPIVSSMPGGQLFWAHAWYVATSVLRSAGAGRARSARLAAAAGLPDLAACLSWS